MRDPTDLDDRESFKPIHVHCSSDKKKDLEKERKKERERKRERRKMCLILERKFEPEIQEFLNISSQMLPSL